MAIFRHWTGISDRHQSELHLYAAQERQSMLALASPSASQRSLQARHDQFSNSVADYRYTLPRKMALDEAREQLLVDIAHSRLGPPKQAAHPPVTVMALHRLGGVLVRIGSRLLRVHPVAPVATSGSSPGAP